MKTLDPVIEGLLLTRVRQKQIPLILSDKQRPGTTATFTLEQIVEIIAIACELPATSHRPINHWSPREVADEAIKRGIVEQISPHSVGRFLSMQLLYNPIRFDIGSTPTPLTP